VVLCSFSTAGYFDISGKMVTIGGKRKMEEMLEKHMKGSRFD